MLNNIKIKHLIISSVSILLFMLILAGSASIYYTKSISEQTETLYEKPHTNLVAMWQVKTEVLAFSNVLKDSALLGKALPNDVQQNIKAIPEQLITLEANKVDAKSATSDDMKKIMTLADEWSKAAQQITNDLTNNPTNVTPMSYNTYNDLSQSLVTSLDSIIVTASANALKFKDNSVTDAHQAQTVLIIFFIVAVTLALIILRFILRSISRPLNIIVQAADQIAAGNLDAEIPYQSNNEFGELAVYFQRMKDYLKTIINDIAFILQEMGHGNFNAQSQVDYIGSFAPILSSLEKINIDLTHTLYNIDRSAEQVASGSEQVSGGSQALAQGTTEQASSIEELSATIAEITVQIKNNAENAAMASQKVNRTSDQMATSNQQMQKMMQAMTEISTKSDEIEKIIKTIEDIAFQTNILALNAAVEAARAGSAGKGFAVVADEVRNLAGKSAAAAKNTTELIEGTIQAVTNGTNIASETAQSMLTVVSATQEVSKIVDKISEASDTQAIAAEQINLGIEQISTVVHNNTATAEQSAAASEELFLQADLLKNLVNKFHLCTKADLSVSHE